MPLKMLRAANVLFSRVYHELDVIAAPKLPRTGAGIVVCNHISGLDPALIQSVSPRLIVWMMAREFYDMPGMNTLFRQLHAIPVERSGKDLTATRKAMRALHDGHILGIFPEGRIALTRELLPFQTGAAMMAIRMNVPIYPAGLDGTQRNKPMLQACTRPQRARIAFGQEIRLHHPHTDQQAPEAATSVIQLAIATLRQRL